MPHLVYPHKTALLGGISPVALGIFTNQANDFTTLSTLSSMPTGGSISRSGNAMLYDSTGKLTYAPNNVLLYSQDYRNTAQAGSTRPWFQENVTLTYPASSVTAPDGTSTANLIDDGTVASAYHDLNYTFTTVAGVKYAMSIYVKDVSRQYFGVGVYTSSSNYTGAVYDVSLSGITYGTVTDSKTSGLGVLNATSIASVGSGWYRVGLTFTAWAASTVVQFSASSTTTVSSYGCPAVYTGSNKQLLVWGAQLEAVTWQTAPRDYVATTSAAYYGPRFDTDPATLAAKGLLIEGARTNLCQYSGVFQSAGPWWYANDTPSATTTNVAPDGTSSAYSWAYNTGSTGYYTTQISFTGNSTYTISLYVKNVSGTGTIRFGSDNTKFSPTTSRAYVDFKPSDGTFSNVQAGVTAYGKQDVGNGWYRVWLTTTKNSTTETAGILAYLMTSGTIAAWGYQVEVGSFASSYIPTVASSTARAAETFSITGYATNLIEAFYTDEQTGGSWSANYNAGVAPSTSFAWTTSLRVYNNAYAGDIATPVWIDNSGTTGNRMVTDSTGTLTWAPANMVIQSSDLTVSPWTKNDAAITVTGGQADPTGGSNAFKIVFPGADKSFYQNIGTNTGTLLNAIWIKGTAGETIQFNEGYTNSPVTLTGSWQQITFRSATIRTTNYIDVDTFYSSTARTVYVYAPQSEQVTYQQQPRLYIATTDATKFLPRYDYSAATVPATPLGMLIEESRQNQITYAQAFDNAAWTKYRCSVSTSAGTAPDGTNTAFATVQTTGQTSAGVINNNTPSLAGSVSVAFSVYAKAKEKTFLTLGSDAANSVGVNTYSYFNLSTGVVGTTGAGQTASIQNVGNGWYRCTIVSTTRSAGGVVGLFLGGADTNGSFTVTDNGGIYVWGAQGELGSFSTSYVPTVSSGVTRVADVVKLTGSALTTLQGSAVSSLAETALYSDADTYVVAARQTAGGSYGNVMALGTKSSYINSGSVAQFSKSYSPAPNATSVSRVGIAAKANDFACVANNGTVQSGSSGVMPVGINEAYLGYYVDGGRLNGWARSLALYNQRLPDAILKQKSSVNAPY